VAARGAAQQAAMPVIGFLPALMLTSENHRQLAQPCVRSEGLAGRSPLDAPLRGNPEHYQQKACLDSAAAELIREIMQRGH
jgi:hypothetical protein